MRSGLAVLCLLFVSLAAAPARAGEAASTSYAIVRFDVSGDSSATLRAKVEAGLKRGVAEAGADLIDFDAVQKAVAGKPDLAACNAGSCLTAVGQAVGTDALLAVTITANGANYQIDLALVGPSGTIRKRTGSCTVCTVSDLADVAATRVTELLTAVAGAPLPVEIDTAPSGAALAIAGVGVATAPWKGELAPGSVAVDATMPGYTAAHQDLTIVDDGSDHRFDLSLSPAVVKPRFARLKWIVGGAAAATLITGIALLAVDGSPSCGASGASCPRLYSTAAGGAVLTILGVAGASAAGYMFWHDRHHREASAAVAPTAGGAAAALRMSF